MKSTRRSPYSVEVTDTATGETGMRVLLEVRHLSRSKMTEPFLMVVLPNARALARLRLTVIQYRVLWMLVGRCRAGSVVLTLQAQLARDLELAPSQVSRAIKALSELNIVKRVVDGEGRSLLQLNRDLFVMLSDGPARGRRSREDMQRDAAATAAALEANEAETK